MMKRGQTAAAVMVLSWSESLPPTDLQTFGRTAGRLPPDSVQQYYVITLVLQEQTTHLVMGRNEKYVQ